MGPKKKAVEKAVVFIDGNPVELVGNIQINPQIKEKATCKVPLNYNVNVTFRPTWRFRLWLWWLMFKVKLKWWKENRNRGT